MYWLLDVPYKDRTDAKWAGARWDPLNRCWAYRGSTLPDKLRRWAPKPHTWERWRHDDINGFAPAALSGPGVELRPHQDVAAQAVFDAWVAGYPGFLLADEVGLGKTYAAIDGVNRIGPGMHVLVLAPLSVVAHWRRSIDAIGDGGNRWCVVNYDRAKSLLEAPESAKAAKRTRTRNKRHATKGRSIVEWDIVICDEAHRLRNPASQRAAAVRQLVKSHGNDAFVVWMSATAGQNPLELAYLAPLLAHQTGERVGALDDFEAWCRSQGIGVRRGPFGSWVWERNDADLELMCKLLFSGDPVVGMRRRPQDIAGWPELTRVAWPVPLEGAERALYEQAWEEFRAALALRGPRTKRGKVSQNALVAALRFRQKASLLRADKTAQLVADLVEDGRQVAVSVAFLESAERIAEGLARRRIRSERIDGTLPAAAREEARVRFQTGETPVVCFTVTEGISLHAGERAVGATDTERALVVHDLRWSALELAQIEGRCHRGGQNAVAYHLFGEGTVEAVVAEAVIQRLCDMAHMLGDDTTGLDALLDAAVTAR